MSRRSAGRGRWTTACRTRPTRWSPFPLPAPGLALLGPRRRRRLLLRQEAGRRGAGPTGRHLRDRHPGLTVCQVWTDDRGHVLWTEDRGQCVSPQEVPQGAGARPQPAPHSARCIPTVSSAASKAREMTPPVPQSAGPELTAVGRDAASGGLGAGRRPGGQQGGCLGGCSVQYIQLRKCNI
jgi:hypothetical protein